MGARRTDAHGVASASEKTDFSDSTIRARDTTPCSPEILRGQPNTPESTKPGGDALSLLYAFRGTTVLYHSKREDVGGNHQEEHPGARIRSFCSRHYTRARASLDVMGDTSSESWQRIGVREYSEKRVFGALTGFLSSEAVSYPRIE